MWIRDEEGFTMVQIENVFGINLTMLTEDGTRWGLMTWTTGPLNMQMATGSEDRVKEILHDLSQAILSDTPPAVFDINKQYGKAPTGGIQVVHGVLAPGQGPNGAPS